MPLDVAIEVAVVVDRTIGSLKPEVGIYRFAGGLQVAGIACDAIGIDQRLGVSEVPGRMYAALVGLIGIDLHSQPLAALGGDEGATGRQENL